VTDISGYASQQCSASLPFRPAGLPKSPVGSYARLGRSSPTCGVWSTHRTGIIADPYWGRLATLR